MLAHVVRDYRRGRTHEITQPDLILVNGKGYGYIIGLGVRPFYLSARKRGYYHVLAGPSTAGQLLTRLWRFFRGVPADLDSLYDNMSRHLVIEFAEPQAFTINGDICEPVSVLKLEPGPRVSFISG